MRKATKVLLVCNYLPDGQQSMLRFGELLESELPNRNCAVQVVRPRPHAAKLLRQTAFGGWRRWFGYFDKYVLFPRELTRCVATESALGPLVVHIVDHSNAVYVPRLPTVPWVVTCHDLLAVRGALGENTDCPASRLGKKLQLRIAAGLGRAQAVACDSTSTLLDLERLVRPAGPQTRGVILLGLNHPYRALASAEARARLAVVSSIPWDQPFLIHVGSNLRRKNKAAVIRILGLLAGRWTGNLMFCGAELNDELRAQARAAGLGSRLFGLTRPSNEQLEAAYSLAHALVFPSTCEGFGWPIIEAQACGCPVICSDRTSLPEIGGGGALVHALADEGEMAESVILLAEPSFRADRVRRGFDNLKRFTIDEMIGHYIKIYAAAGGDSGRMVKGTTR